jgi:uncharacterized iron-regulated membrane protein
VKHGSWPDYAAIWRWHFYAGLICLPFFCWLALTGMAYLFRPDIEALLDRPYENLTAGQRAAPSQEVRAALAAMPGATFAHYEPPATPGGAAQIVVTQGDHPWRVIVHPITLKPLHIGRDDHRPMDLISHLHGQLLMGDRGSNLVETAGSWGVVMIVTGLCLWWPRGRWRAAGLVYPRLGQRGRLFWRDLHAVSGLWISTVTLFLLLSGLPWSSFWGQYLTWGRNHWALTAGAPDWSLGGGPEPMAMPGMSAAEMAAMPAAPMADLAGLDIAVPAARRLDVPRPVWILPGKSTWIVQSHSQDRPLRVDYALSPVTGAVTASKTFADDDPIDRAVNVAIAAHEGHLFGRLNQAVLLLNALGVLGVTISAAVMWWRRRPPGRLGAPPRVARPGAARLAVLGGVVVALSLVLPLFGLSLVAVLLLDALVLRRFPGAGAWLGTREP